MRIHSHNRLSSLESPQHLPARQDGCTKSRTSEKKSPTLAALGALRQPIMDPCLQWALATSYDVLERHVNDEDGTARVEIRYHTGRGAAQTDVTYEVDPSEGNEPVDASGTIDGRPMDEEYIFDGQVYSMNGTVGATSEALRFTDDGSTGFILDGQLQDADVHLHLKPLKGPDAPAGFRAEGRIDDSPIRWQAKMEPGVGLTADGMLGNQPLHWEYAISSRPTRQGGRIEWRGTRTVGGKPEDVAITEKMRV